MQTGTKSKRWADSDVSDLLESGNNDKVRSSTYKVSKKAKSE